MERENKMGPHGIRAIIKKIESFWYFCAVKGKIIGGTLFQQPRKLVPTPIRTNPNQTDSIKISNTKEENFEDFTFFESFVRISTGTNEDIRTR